MHRKHKRMKCYKKVEDKIKLIGMNKKNVSGKGKKLKTKENAKKKTKKKQATNERQQRQE